MPQAVQLSEKMFIIGAGGHAREILSVLAETYPQQNLQDWVKFVVPNDQPSDHQVMGVGVLTESEFSNPNSQVIVGIGDSLVRRKVVEKLKAQKCHFPTLVHPKASLSQWVHLDQGCYVASGVVMTCNIHVAEHSHFNLLSSISHDCNIGSFFTAAPGVHISGECEFGENVSLGTGAVVRNQVKVSSNVTIGMGSVVVKSIEEPGTYLGVPAKKVGGQ